MPETATRKREGLYPLDKVRLAIDDIADLVEARRLVMLKAYFDESKGGQTPRVFAIAGYVAHHLDWRKLSFEWNNVLLKYGIKGGLHMKAFAHFKGEFAKFRDNELDRRNFLRDLIGTLYKGRPFIAIGCGVDIDAFARLPQHIKDEFHNDPYQFSFLLCVRGVVEHSLIIDLPPSEKVGFIFDRRDGFQGHALALFNAVKDTPTIPHRERMGDLAFASRMNLPALQAADFAAYEVRKGLEAKMLGQNERWGIQKIQKGECHVFMGDRPSLVKWFKLEAET